MLNDLIGINFKYGGRGPTEYDCYGLAIEVLSRMGKTLPNQYLSVENPADIEKSLDDGKQFLKQISAPVKGCLVMFRIVPPFVSHLGVMLDSKRFIHVFRKRLVCIESIDSVLWKNKVAGFYDLK